MVCWGRAPSCDVLRRSPATDGRPGRNSSRRAASTEPARTITALIKFADTLCGMAHLSAKTPSFKIADEPSVATFCSNGSVLTLVKDAGPGRQARSWKRHAPRPADRSTASNRRHVVVLNPRPHGHPAVQFSGGSRSCTRSPSLRRPILKPCEFAVRARLAARRKRSLRAHVPSSLGIQRRLSEVWLGLRPPPPRWHRSAMVYGLLTFNNFLGPDTSAVLAACALSVLDDTSDRPKMGQKS